MFVDWSQFYLLKFSLQQQSVTVTDCNKLGPVTSSILISSQSVSHLKPLLEVPAVPLVSLSLSATRGSHHPTFFWLTCSLTPPFPDLPAQRFPVTWLWSTNLHTPGFHLDSFPVSINTTQFLPVSVTFIIFVCLFILCVVLRGLLCIINCIKSSVTWQHRCTITDTVSHLYSYGVQRGLFCSIRCDVSACL